jgi:hypothetical protein
MTTLLLILLLVSTSHAGIKQTREMNMANSGTLPAMQMDAGGSSTIDIPASAFLPSRNSPSEFMSTATILYYGGEYWVDDSTAQQFTVAIEATADHNGYQYVIIYETVGYIGITDFPAILRGREILGVEIWFGVKSSNLYPDELIAITPIDFNLHPTNPMQHSNMVDLYYDIGVSDNQYAAYNFPAGSWYNIDLGTAGVEDFKEGRRNGFFGIGFTASGWRIEELYGATGIFHIAGGGELGFEPFFRITYSNAVNTEASSFGAIKSLFSDN